MTVTSAAWRRRRARVDRRWAMGERSVARETPGGVAQGARADACERTGARECVTRAGGWRAETTAGGAGVTRGNTQTVTAA